MIPDGNLQRICDEPPQNVNRQHASQHQKSNHPPSSVQRWLNQKNAQREQERHLKEELLLGIGGWRLLSALGIKPEVCHLNEGHAAFATLERARGFMEEPGQPFEVALAVTRAGNLFTTHTAVSPGFDRLAPDLIELHDLLALGRQNSNDSSKSFNMAYLAIRGSGAVNGVSRLHGKVSRHLFEPLSPAGQRTKCPSDT